MGHYSSFIIRLWIEPQVGYRWGIIQHVATRDRRRFSTLAEMLEFISRHSGDDTLAHQLDPSSPNPTTGSPSGPDPTEAGSAAGPFDPFMDISVFSDPGDPGGWQEVEGDEPPRPRATQQQRRKDGGGQPARGREGQERGKRGSRRG